MGEFLDPKEMLDLLDLYGPMVVADFGTGAGHFALEAAQRISSHGRVYAFDILPERVAYTRKAAKDSRLYTLRPLRRNLEGREGSGLRSGSVDTVIAAHILFQAKKPENITKEAARILKPGGKLLIIEWRPDSDIRLGPPFERRLAKETVTAFSKNEGLEILREHPPGAAHYSILFIKPHDE